MGVRLCSIKAGLATITVTPGRTSPLVSLTAPAIALCALVEIAANSSRTDATAIHQIDTPIYSRSVEREQLRHVKVSSDSRCLLERHAKRQKKDRPTNSINRNIALFHPRILLRIHQMHGKNNTSHMTSHSPQTAACQAIRYLMNFHLPPLHPRRYRQFRPSPPVIPEIVQC